MIIDAGLLRCLSALHTRLGDIDDQIVIDFPHFFDWEEINHWYDPIQFVEDQDDGEKLPEQFTWLHENVASDAWALGFSRLGFKNKNDAFAFRMRWS